MNHNNELYESESGNEVEVIDTQLTIPVSNTDIDINAVNSALDKVNKELDRYTVDLTTYDYGAAVVFGLSAGLIDSLFVGETIVSEQDIGLSHKQINKFIENYARSRGIDKERLNTIIGALEEEFKVAQDNVWSGKGIRVSTKNHHLADLAHHPTPVGLLSAVIVQFLRVGTFVNRDGEWHLEFVETNSKKYVTEVIIPCVITGMLHWVVNIVEEKSKDASLEIPKGLEKLVHLATYTPVIYEVVKVADNWFGHLVSDMGGSKNTAGQGMGIPGVFISLLYEIASLPVLKDTDMLEIVNALYAKNKLDMRHELAYIKAAKNQVIPVACIETFTRLYYFLTRFLNAAVAHHKDEVSWKSINWNSVIPFNNRSVERMMTIAHMTFTTTDTADAAVRSAIESGGNFVIFSTRFATRFNYVGAGAATISIVKEVSNEAKETQLIHEKMLLSTTKAEYSVVMLQEFKAKLEEKLSAYLVEDLTSYMEGFEYISAGIDSNDSDMVIKGNTVIQRALGREPQFTNQEEFDEFMESDIPLQL